MKATIGELLVGKKGPTCRYCNYMVTRWTSKCMCACTDIFQFGHLTLARHWDGLWQSSFDKKLCISVYAEANGFYVEGWVGEHNITTESKPTPQEALDEAYAEICRRSKELTDFLEQYLGGPKETK